MEGIRTLELYSGIGGMHFALKQSCPYAKVVAAVDINTNVNKVYAHNFPDVKVMDKGIEGFSVKNLDSLHFNMVLMSPPCQPFTRIGLQKDINDPRTKSFVHFLSVLPKLEKLPDYILLENVKGFEVSEAHSRLCITLDECGYQRQEFLLSPKHLGIPNSRLRYFMLAKKGCFHPSLLNKNGEIWETLPIPTDELEKLTKSVTHGDEDSSEPITKKVKVEENGIKFATDKNGEVSCHPLEQYMEKDIPPEDYGVADKVKTRYLKVMDIVTPESTNSACFTKSYTHYAEATGSVLNLKKHTKTLIDSSERSPDDYDLRYFSPREVANLMCFPQEFGFSDGVTRKQQYKMLGNSLNVKVVSYLISLLLLKEDDTLATG